MTDEELKTAIAVHTAKLAGVDMEPVAEFVKASFGNYPVFTWQIGYVAVVGDKFYAATQLAAARVRGAADERAKHIQLVEAVDALLANEEHAVSGGMHTYQKGSSTDVLWRAVENARTQQEQKQ
jgi:hypothetical protein